MSVNEIHRTIDWIDKAIQDQATGSPDQLAGRLKMSVRLLYYYLDMMKLLGAEIEYSSRHNSFIYLRAGYFINGYKWIGEKSKAC